MMNLFSVSALFVCEHFPALPSDSERLWEEVIIVLSCYEEEVVERSVQYFKSHELEYKTIDGGKAEWKFYGIIDIYEVTENELILKSDSPMEFFSRHLTDRQAKELCRHSKTLKLCRHGKTI